MLTLLTHPNPLVRVVTGWLTGVAVLSIAWVASYSCVPEGVVGPWSLAAKVPLDSGRGVALLALQIFAWNLGIGVGITVLGSLFSVGRFPLGYLAPWAWFAAYGVLLGTNSFAIPNPTGRIAPHLEVAWTRSGLREVTAYLLVAAALTNLYLWRQRSWWDWRPPERVRRWKDVRLLRAEALCLVLALVLLAWSASVEAWQIARMSP